MTLNIERYSFLQQQLRDVERFLESDLVDLQSSCEKEGAKHSPTFMKSPFNISKLTKTLITTVPYISLVNFYFQRRYKG